MITSFFSPRENRAEKRLGADIAASAPSTQDSLDSGSKRARRATPTDREAESSKREKTASSSSHIPPAPSVFGQRSANYASEGDLSADVVELLSSLENDESSLPKGAKTWRKALNRRVSLASFATLAKFVKSERSKGKRIYPPPADVFSALNSTPLHSVKVVIVGQDPYHGPNQGHGLAFSVRKGIMIPPSLRNIYKELMNDASVDFPNVRPSHGNLEKWAKQGVLMLNAVLTVRGGEANSHKGRGWEQFTDECIRIVDHENRARNSAGKKTGIVFLLWGRPAAKKAETAGVISKAGGHEIICTSHPSPLGATKTKSPFLGSKCFSRANKALVERGLEPIDWNVD